MDSMFNQCFMPKEFKLRDKFIVNNGCVTDCMFEECDKNFDDFHQKNKRQMRK